MLLAILTISASAIAFTACSDDDNDTGGNDSGNNTEIKGDYTATTNVKTITLKSVDASQMEYDADYKEKNCVYIYEDFNYKYSLALSDGNIMLIPFQRMSGNWQVPIDYGIYNRKYYRNVYIEDVGNVSSIYDVTRKVDLPNHTIFPAVQPKHGYAACFQTDNGIQNLRIYISNYKLDNEGALKSITVQYQLY